MFPSLTGLPRSGGDLDRGAGDDAVQRFVRAFNEVVRIETQTKKLDSQRGSDLRWDGGSWMARVGCW